MTDTLNIFIFSESKKEKNIKIYNVYIWCNVRKFWSSSLAVEEYYTNYLGKHLIMFYYVYIAKDSLNTSFCMFICLFLKQKSNKEWLQDDKEYFVRSPSTFSANWCNLLIIVYVHVYNQLLRVSNNSIINLSISCLECKNKKSNM